MIEEIGQCVSFTGVTLQTLWQRPCKFSTVCDQIWRVTMQSLPTTAMAGFFVGAIMTVQFAMQIKSFGALGYLGGLATSGTFREVGPLLIAFMLAGKVGAFTAAELGTMRVTEQIDAIRCLGADPIQEIILPRFIAIIISSFFLLGAGLMMSTLGGIGMGMAFAGISPEEFLRHVPTIVTLPSIANGLFKCLIFSIVLASVCTYQGYHTTGGAKGVGRSVVTTAVVTMVGLVLADWLTSLVTDAILQAFVS